MLIFYTNFSGKSLFPLKLTELLRLWSRDTFGDTLWYRQFVTHSSVHRLYYRSLVKLLGVIFQDNFKMDMHVNFVFTAQCTLVHLRGIAIACRLSVCPSVCL